MTFLTILGVSDAEVNTFRPFNGGGIADLPLLRILLAICQKSWEPSFWEVMDSFLSAYGSLAASTITSQSELYFSCRRFILLAHTNQKNDLYEQWQQHKQVKTIEMSEGWPDIFYEGYINKFQPEPTHKIH